MIGSVRFLTCAAIVVLAAGTASAQTAPTCSFDAASATLTITVNGQPANVTRPGGQIRLNGVDCVGATTTTIDTVVISGGALSDVVTVTGIYAPGLTAEDVGSSEIEILVDLGGGEDDLRIKTQSNQTTRVLFTAGGIDLGTGPDFADGDEDVTIAGVEAVRVSTAAGNDLIHGGAYLGGAALYLHGGAGGDRLYGSPQADSLYGEDGNDHLQGGGGNDNLYDGPGDDVVHGGVGNDVLWQDATANGADDLYGDAGWTTVNYSKRTSGVFVSVDGVADDGESGEGDNVAADVQIVYGGRGADVLVGNSAQNVFYGGPGDDELYGQGGDDDLQAQAGNDIVVGDDGNDTLSGGPQQDFVAGGAGADWVYGDDGRDIVNGDDGADYLFCGAGIDDSDGNPTDALVYQCEL